MLCFMKVLFVVMFVVVVWMLGVLVLVYVS